MQSPIPSRPVQTSCSIAHRPLPGWRVGRRLHQGQWLDHFAAAPVAAGGDRFDYVIKSTREDLSPAVQEQATSRLTSEAIVSGEARHKNIIPLLDAELDKAPFYLVQPLIRGASIQQLQQSRNLVPLSRLVWLLRQSAQAVLSIHEINRVALCLHPTHILIGVNGDVAMIGSGNSIPGGEPLGASLETFPLENFGLPYFAAPEVFDPHYRGFEMSDVWSLGALIYYTLSGRPPFVENEFGQLCSAVCSRLHKDVQLLQPACPGSLNHLVNQMLSKDPIRRPDLRSVIDLLISLELELIQDATMIELAVADGDNCSDRRETKSL